MKKLITGLLLLITFGLMAQNSFIVSGYVYENDNNNPLENYLIMISVFNLEDSTVILFNEQAYTDDQGYYIVDGSFEAEIALLEVGTYSCDDEYISFQYILSQEVEVIEQNFVVCDNQNPDCEAYFEYYFENEATIQFINLSSGEGLNFFWDFGDGNYSNEESPIHNYEYEGEYYVVLVIANADSTCIEDYQEWIIVGGGQGECEAYFEYYLGDGLTVEFENLSVGDDLSYYWDFGDGSYSTEENPTHIYEFDSEYYVVLVIINGDSTCVEDYQEWIIVSNEQGECEAYFEYYAGDGLTVEFENLSQGEDLLFYWDFGDGNSAVEENPTHTYNAPGIYEVCLLISSDDSTCYSIYCEPIVIDDSSTCLAQFAYYPADSMETLAYQFIDLSYGNIESWYWDFGDGTFSYDQNPIHIFGDEGAYYVCLTVTNGDNCESTWCEEVYIYAFEECYNFFTYQNVGNTILFQGYVSNNAEADYFWDFGDGNSGEGQTLSHEYDETGTYFVSLSTIDDDSCFAFSSQIIVVGDSIDYNQIYGQVFEGNFPLEEGFAMIFSIDQGGNNMPFIDFATIDSSGVYTFPYVPNGEFVIYAIPFNNNGYLPTYYGDVVNWDEATIVSLGTPNNPYDINLVQVEGATLTGVGSISGTVSSAFVREGLISNATILLYNESYELTDYTEVDNQGTFYFHNLANGTYYIYTELPGTSSSFIRADITDDQQDVIVNMTLEGNSILGIDEQFKNTEVGDVYPNPVVNIAHIEITNQSKTTTFIEVLDMWGKRVYRKEILMQVGTSTVSIPLEGTQAGLYFIRISNLEGESVSKKVIKN